MAPDNMKFIRFDQRRRPSSRSSTAWQKMPFVAVDTELCARASYWPDLCLIQIASSDEAAAIDPRRKGLDMKPC
jgi:ribonuclease D